jgi:hypothetical protein
VYTIVLVLLLLALPSNYDAKARRRSPSSCAGRLQAHMFGLEEEEQGSDRN